MKNDKVLKYSLYGVGVIAVLLGIVFLTKKNKDDDGDDGSNQMNP